MSLLDKFSSGANKGFDEAINVIKGDKSVADAMKDIKNDLGKNDNRK